MAEKFGKDLWTLSDLCTPWCIHVVATLRVADRIAAGHADIGNLATAAGADHDSLYRVMRHLARNGVFEQPAPGHFALNEISSQLLDASVRIGLDLDAIGGRMAHAWGTMLSAVRTGKPAYHEAFGRGFWDDLEANPPIAESFDALMGPTGHGAPDPHVVADWSSVKTVVDVGGGTGALLAAILQLNPEVRGTLVDLPRPIARSHEIFEAAGVSDRVTTAGQSFFDPLPAGADLYILKNVLSDWPDGEVTTILKRCAEAAKPSGRIVIFTKAGPGDEASPELLMMVLVGGKDRTLDELRALASEAGLEMTATRKTPKGRNIAEFRVI